MKTLIVVLCAIVVFAAGNAAAHELVAYWPLTNGSLVDATGHGNDLVASGSLGSPPFPAADCAAQDSNAYSLDSWDDLLTCSPHYGLQDSMITVACWAFLRGIGDDSGADDFITKHRGLDGSNAYALFVLTRGADSAKVAFQLDGGCPRDPECPFPSGQVVSNTRLTLNEWHHVAATFDAMTMRLYVDGVAEGSLEYPHPILYCCGGGYELWVGGIGNRFLQMLSGNIDEIRIYDYALPPEDIAVLASGCDWQASTSVPAVAPNTVASTWGTVKNLYR